MKKGELRRDAILNAAEALFIERGYDETSIQDILDALSLSKGGFYHYFESKLQLLEEIAARRARADVERLRMEIASWRFTAAQKLNRLFSAVLLVNGGDPRFAALSLKIGFIDGDVNFRERNRAILLESLCPLADAAVEMGVKDGEFFTRRPERISRITLMLACDANDECCRALAMNPQSPDSVIEIMNIVSVYQECMETLLGAKFGSIRLSEVEPMADFVRQINVQFQESEA